MKRDSVLSLISIAKKAGKIASGEFQTETAVKSVSYTHLDESIIICIQTSMRTAVRTSPGRSNPAGGFFNRIKQVPCFDCAEQ